MTHEKNHQTLSDLRQMAFDTLADLRNGKLDVTTADAANRLMTTIIATAQVEINNRKVVAETNLGNDFFPPLSGTQTRDGDRVLPPNKTKAIPQGENIVEQLNAAGVLRTHRLT